MNKKILPLNQSTPAEATIESYVSFKKFVEFVENKITNEPGTRVKFYKYVLERFRACPELMGAIPIEETKKYDELLELVLSMVVPLSEDENEVLLALGNALSTEAFYSTNAFYTLMEPWCMGKVDRLGGSHDEAKVIKEVQYRFILNKLYGINSAGKNEWIKSFIHDQTGLYKYYRLSIDSRFVDVQPKGVLPVINPAAIQQQLIHGNGYEVLEEVLPLSSFTSTGFAIITLTDVTTQQAVEEIGKVVSNITNDNSASSFVEITLLLQTIMGSSDCRFGLMPFFMINDRAAILYENFPFSILVEACWNARVSKEDLSAFINIFLQSPALITFDATVKNTDLPDVIQNALQLSAISFYTIVPVYYNSQLVGLFETATNNPMAAPNAFQLNNLSPAIPYISQLLRLFIDKFNITIDAIVKDKFTNIQPAVQWKFNEVAWHHFRSNEIERKDVALETIAFTEVYPLYGAVDMRNSTIERNRVLREDLRLQVELLTEIFSLLEYEREAAPILEACNNWGHHLIHDIHIEELQLVQFVKQEVHPYLKSLPHLPLDIKQKISSYFNSLDEQTGAVFLKRRQLENSIQLINRRLGDYFDKFKEDLQLLYPCYFEKFRTDGIEYDIYIGQSIAPKIPFSANHLQQLRLWQVSSMADIAKLTDSLLPGMQHPLQTTQLLYVNAHTIDITFRRDERRFDVEGTYNVRYHIVKKRIDKVHILHTTERLTQPGKIAIVYSEDHDAVEYAGYIHQLQQQQVLLNDLEYLELEELQGVAGLKALRVGVPTHADALLQTSADYEVPVSLQS